jgi:alkanesulfonate monooxygenase SsuD/methylene tetrahydromethanopterin reductase-like flavin-dependent oxidoreductase (luciferase family)
LKFIEKCGIMLEPQLGMSVSKLLEMAETAESLGFGYLCRSDHLIDTGGRKGRESPECWTTLAAIATRTSSIKFGPLVSPIGFRNPAVLATMARTVHSLAKGRLQLGVGAGWYEHEYASYGIPFPPFKVRDEQLDEALQIIRPATQGKSVDFRGKHFSAHLEGRPFSAGKIHLVIGGAPRSIIRKAAKYADEWNFTSLPPPERMKEARAVLGSAGRHIEVSQMGSFVIAENEAQLRQKARAMMRKAGASGDAESYLKQLRSKGRIAEPAKEFGDRLVELIDAGVEKFYFQVLDPGDTESVDLLASVLKRV